MVRSLDIREFVEMSNQWRGVDFARLDQAQNLRAIASRGPCNSGFGLSINSNLPWDM